MKDCKSLQVKVEVYIRPIWASVMKLFFCENSEQLCLHKKDSIFECNQASRSNYHLKSNRFWRYNELKHKYTYACILSLFRKKSITVSYKNYINLPLALTH